MKKHRKIGSFVVLTRKNKSEVFLVLRSDYSVWEPQGGGIEQNEKPEKAAIREALEETGFKVKLLRKVAEYKIKNSTVTNSHLFLGEIISGTFKPEYKGCKGRWFNVQKLPLNMTESKRRMISDCLQNTNKLIQSDEITPLYFKNAKILFLLPFQSLKYILKYFIQK